MHAGLITITASFSAAAAPGSALMFSRSAYGVPEAHGFARCGRAAPIGLAHTTIQWDDGFAVSYTSDRVQDFVDAHERILAKAARDAEQRKRGNA